VRVFTGLTDLGTAIHLSQHSAQSAVDALREHVSGIPREDLSDNSDEEVEFLRRVAAGDIPATLHPSGWAATWLWLEGARRQPRYLTYIVQTDTRE